MQRPKRKQPPKMVTRRFRSRGVDVEIREGRKRVELKLDGQPIPVAIIDGKVHCQLAGQFRTFESIDEVVDTLLANEGRTWTLHGHVCDERCGEGGHHHHDHPAGHDHAEHDHASGHDHGRAEGHRHHGGGES